MPNPEITRFKSPEELKEEEIERKIKERGLEGEILGGIVFEEEKVVDPETKEERVKRYIYIGNPYEERPIIIKLETDATQEDVEVIKKREIIPMRESFEILVAMAMTYKHRQPLLIEGPTAIGKTYLAEKFTELLYGRGVKPLDFYCSGQTDVSELMAKWVPRVETEEEKRKWEQFLELSGTQEKLYEIAQEVEQAEGSPEQKLALIHRRLQELAKSAGLSERTQWRFQYGAVPKAMGLSRNPDGSFSFDEQRGMGFILHIEEVGLAEPQVINALLKLRGKRGKLAEEIQLWENGGRKIKAGPKFWAFFSTNPPEEYLARNEVDPALARGVVFIRMGELSEESLRLAAEYYFTYKLGEKPKEKPEGCILDIWSHPEIGREIAEVVSAIHSDLNKELKKGEKGRQQRIPLTLDDMARVADALIDTQIRNKETGLLDLTETLKKLLEFYYLNRLADRDLKETMEANIHELLEGDTGKKEFEGKVRTRREIFDILVERASMTEEEKERSEQEKIERERRELEQAKHNAEDAIMSVLQNPDIPEEIKKHLREIKLE
jgi:MoxR-like ATPase